MREWPQAHVIWPGFHSMYSIYIYSRLVDRHYPPSSIVELLLFGLSNRIFITFHEKLELWMALQVSTSHHLLSYNIITTSHHHHFHIISKHAANSMVFCNFVRRAVELLHHTGIWELERSPGLCQPGLQLDIWYENPSWRDWRGGIYFGTTIHPMK